MQQQEEQNHIQQDQQYPPSYQKNNHQLNKSHQPSHSIKQKTRNKKNQFHASIVKQKKSQLFKHSREKSRTILIKEQLQSKTNILNTSKKRNLFINSKAKIFAHPPNQNWRSELNDLLYSLNCFQKANEFKIWQQKKIISKLCAAFNRQYKQFGFGAASAEIIQNILYLHPDAVDQFISRQRINDILQLSTCNDLPLSELRHYVGLMTRISFIQKQTFGQTIGIEDNVEYGLKYLRKLTDSNSFDQDYANKAYGFMLCLLSCMSLNFRQKLSTEKIGQMLGIFDQVAEFNQSQALVSKIILVVFNLIIYKPQQIEDLETGQQSCLQFISSRHLVSRLLQLSISKNHEYSQLSWTILHFLSSVLDSQTFAEFSLTHSLITALIQTHKNLENQNKRSASTIKCLLFSCLENLLNGSDFIKQILLDLGPIFVELLMGSLDSTNQEEVRIEAYSCFCKMLRIDNPKVLKKIVFGTCAIQALVDGLKQIRNEQTIQKIVSVLMKVVEMGENLKGKEKLVELMQKEFKIIDVLVDLVQFYKDSQQTCLQMQEMIGYFKGKKRL